MPGPLRGLKVLDFSTLLPGPMATLFLAEAGAEVVKIERPDSGEDMRYYPPKWGDSSVNFSLKTLTFSEHLGFLVLGHFFQEELD